jgi:hypothetical protein
MGTFLCNGDKWVGFTNLCGNESEITFGNVAIFNQNKRIQTL